MLGFPAGCDDHDHDCAMALSLAPATGPDRNGVGGDQNLSRRRGTPMPSSGQIAELHRDAVNIILLEGRSRQQPRRTRFATDQVCGMADVCCWHRAAASDTCASVGDRVGFRMPAGRERSTRVRWPASESLRRTNPRESGERLAVLWGFGVAAALAGNGFPKIAES